MERLFGSAGRSNDPANAAATPRPSRGLKNGAAKTIPNSSCLPEIIDLTDRILVARSGMIAAEFSRAEASAERILHASVH